MRIIVKKFMERIYGVVLVNGQMRRYQAEYRQAHGTLTTFLHMIKVRLFGFPKFEMKKLTYPESQCFARETPEELVQKLATAQVISFDVFDTLLLRTVGQPTDVFHFVGEKIGCMNFGQIRKLAEIEARKNAGGAEVTLRAIYDEVYRGNRIDIEEAMAQELACEEAFCIANPYMHKVYTLLAQQGKKMIATSDMYLSAAFIRKLLHNAGYANIEQVYVSCEHNGGKASGVLYDAVMNNLGKETKYVHIGDNYSADVLGSQRAGWESIYYRQVGEVGAAYRPHNMSFLAGAIYKGLVNNRLHNGAEETTPHYEHGYVCGGIMVVGFCQWLERYAREKGIDRFLFAARDGYIVQSVYKEYFEQVDSRYMYTSRYCMQQLLFARHVDEFVIQAIYTRVERQYGEKKSIQTVFEEVGLEKGVPLLQADGIDPAQILSEGNKVAVGQWICNHVDVLSALFDVERAAAMQYYHDMVEGCTRVAVVDIGWKGTCGLYLKEFLKQMGEKVDVRNALVASASTEDGDICISSGTNSAYLFAYDFNRDLYNQHCTKLMKLHSSLMELLFTTDQPSFLQFGYEKDGKTLMYHFAAQETENVERIAQVQQGILDFARDYMEGLKRLGMNIEIPASDAYAPFASLMDHTAYNTALFGDYVFNELASKNASEKKRTLGDQIKH